MPNTDGSGQEVADSGSGGEASAIFMQELRAQLHAGQKLVARLHAELEHATAEVTSMKRAIAELQHDRDQKEEAQPEDTVRSRSQVNDLAWKGVLPYWSRGPRAFRAWN